MRRNVLGCMSVKTSSISVCSAQIRWKQEGNKRDVKKVKYDKAVEIFEMYALMSSSDCVEAMKAARTWGYEV